MKIYRYEKLDGGGPWCTRDGILRNNPKIKFNDKYLYGCASIEKLKEYFKDYEFLIVDCIIKIYEIPNKNVVSISEREIIFYPN